MTPEEQLEYRQRIKDGLAKLQMSHKIVFKKLYAQNMTAPLDEIVDSIPEEQLKWALTRVLNTLISADDK